MSNRDDEAYEEDDLNTEEIEDRQRKGKMKNRFRNSEIGVVYSGTKINLPDDPMQMTKVEAVDCLQRLISEDEKAVAVHEEVEAYPLDGAFAFMNVLKDTYGWASPVPTKGFFRDHPPTMVNMEIGYGKHVQVIWGEFKVPGISGNLSTGVTRKHGRPIFCIQGEVKRKDQDQVKRIADATRKYVLDHSVYKGKAIRLHTDDDGAFDEDNPPTFMDLSNVRPEELIFSDAVKEQVETNLFTPIERTEYCRKFQIPLKRGVLLEGPYGTGKTMAAYVVAHKCEKNRWTFIYLDRVTALDQALTFARQYAPAVVFAEDVDRVMRDEEERTVEIDDILNTIDGIESKGSEIITCLTTNFVERIEKAMLRPGRLDAVISIEPPDAAAAERLVRMYARGLIADDEPMEDAAKELDGHIPAVIREVVERSKLYAISRLQPGDKMHLKGGDVAGAARGMMRHLELLNPPKDSVHTEEEQLGISLGKVVKKSATNGEIKVLNDIHKKVQQVANRVC